MIQDLWTAGDESVGGCLRGRRYIALTGGIKWRCCRICRCTPDLLVVVFRREISVFVLRADAGVDDAEAGVYNYDVRRHCPSFSSCKKVRGMISSRDADLRRAL